MKRLDVIGVGPAGPGWVSPETQSIIGMATDLVGYGPYLDRLASERHRCHASDNREELERAAQALDLAAEGRHVAVVSGGDPGILPWRRRCVRCWIVTPGPSGRMWSSGSIRGFRRYRLRRPGGGAPGA